ncbi:MAG: hypothetical protein HOH58_06715 [Opitutaceae bacterium]|nr:hypothetical protein [Opitutaceae bacterium]
MATATTGTPTYRRMAELAKTDPVIAARHNLYQHRVVEEFFDVVKDPDCLNNLMDSPAHQDALAHLQQNLEQWMAQTGDPMLDTFRNRDDEKARIAFINAQQEEANQRSGKNRQREQ